MKPKITLKRKTSLARLKSDSKKSSKANPKLVSEIKRIKDIVKKLEQSKVVTEDTMRLQFKL
jgi:hypothetical protein